MKSLESSKLDLLFEQHTSFEKKLRSMTNIFSFWVVWQLEWNSIVDIRVKIYLNVSSNLQTFVNYDFETLKTLFLKLSILLNFQLFWFVTLFHMTSYEYKNLECWPCTNTTWHSRNKKNSLIWFCLCHLNKIDPTPHF